MVFFFTHLFFLHLWSTHRLSQSVLWVETVQFGKDMPTGVSKTKWSRLIMLPTFWGIRAEASLVCLEYSSKYLIKPWCQCCTESLSKLEKKGKTYEECKRSSEGKWGKVCKSTLKFLVRSWRSWEILKVTLLLNVLEKKSKTNHFGRFFPPS